MNDLQKAKKATERARQKVASIEAQIEGLNGAHLERELAAARAEHKRVRGAAAVGEMSMRDVEATRAAVEKATDAVDTARHGRELLTGRKADAVAELREAEHALQVARVRAADEVCVAKSERIARMVDALREDIPALHRLAFFVEGEAIRANVGGVRSSTGMAGAPWRQDGPLFQTLKSVHRSPGWTPRGRSVPTDEELLTGLAELAEDETANAAE